MAGRSRFDFSGIKLIYWVLGAAMLMAVSGGVEQRFLSADGRCAWMAATIGGAGTLHTPQRAFESPFVWHNPFRDKPPRKRTELSAAELRSLDRRAGLCETMDRQCPAVSARTREHCRILQG